MNTIQSNPDTTKNSGEVIDNPEFYNIDACFMLDATGSMQPTIDMARDKIKQIITELKAQYADAKVRIAVVAYRDFRDEQRFEIFPFDESVDAAHTFLASIEANGGGDTPEDVNGGFRNALTLQWGELHTKMLYHLADAPCHGGKKFHDVMDHYPNGLKDDEAWETIFQQLYDQDINYLYFDINGSTSQMFEEFKKIYQSCGQEKSNLVFNYEKIIMQEQDTRRRGYLFRGMVVEPLFGSASTRCDSDESYEKECFRPLGGMRSVCIESAVEKFSSATVKTASEQRSRNVEYRSSRK